MSYKIFISYKYADANVYPLPKLHVPQFQRLSIFDTTRTSAQKVINTLPTNTYKNDLFLGYNKLAASNSILATTARNYVDELERNILKEEIQKWEKDGEDLSNFEDATIWEKLRDKIYDSSITLILISPNMVDRSKPESKQWIPWEVAYSLRQQSRQGITSHPNAMLAVVLPDRNNQYEYFINDNFCFCNGGHNVRVYMMNAIFQILRENMFNITSPSFISCNYRRTERLYTGNYSYISCVKWCDFICNPSVFLEKSKEINANIGAFNICKEVK